MCKAPTGNHTGGYFHKRRKIQASTFSPHIIKNKKCHREKNKITSEIAMM